MQVIAACVFTLSTHVVVNAQTILLDDTRAVIHTEAAQCSVQSAHGDLFQHSSGASIRKFATYTFDVERDGCYSLEEYHPVVPKACGNFSLIPDLVPLRVDYCRGEHAWTYVNQAVNGGQWNKLGRLPFYVDEGEYVISLKEKHAVPQTARTWIADAFRLTWLAPTCHEDDIAQAQKSSPPKSTPREVLLSDVEQTQSPSGVDSQSRPDSHVRDASKVAAAESDAQQTAEPELQNAAFQLLLNEARDDGANSKFFFRAPVDGCYMLEESHPHIPGVVSEPFKVNYCKGLTASGVINHEDGKHDQWNFVAALPFFDDRDGSVTLSRQLIARSGGAHQFRVTHVGPSCAAPHAQVHHAEIRIHANFAQVKDSLREFRNTLTQVLETEWLQPADVHPSRAGVMQVREGSIIADVIVLPTAHSPSLAGPTASTAVSALQEYAASPDFQNKICSAANAYTSSCTVGVQNLGPAKPLAVPDGEDIVQSQNADDTDNTDEHSRDSVKTWLIPVIVSIAALVLIVLPVCAHYVVKLRRKQATTESSVPSCADESYYVEVIAKKEMGTQWEDCSTLTPDMDAANVDDIDAANMDDTTSSYLEGLDKTQGDV